MLIGLPGLFYAVTTFLCLLPPQLSPIKMCKAIWDNRFSHQRVCSLSLISDRSEVDILKQKYVFA